MVQFTKILSYSTPTDFKGGKAPTCLNAFADLLYVTCASKSIVEQGLELLSPWSQARLLPNRSLHDAREESYSLHSVLVPSVCEVDVGSKGAQSGSLSVVFRSPYPGQVFVVDMGMFCECFPLLPFPFLMTWPSWTGASSPDIPQSHGAVIVGGGKEGRWFLNCLFGHRRGPLFPALKCICMNRKCMYYRCISGCGIEVKSHHKSRTPGWHWKHFAGLGINKPATCHKWHGPYIIKIRVLGNASQLTASVHSHATATNTSSSPTRKKSTGMACPVWTTSQPCVQ